jgi:hypothetical protein
MSDKDRERVRDLCRRIERVLQRDWGSTGTSLRERLGTTRYVVPPELRKRIRYLHGLQKQAMQQEKFRLKSPADFETKGEQVLADLAAARKTAARRLRPWLGDLIRRYRVLFAVSVLALLVAGGGAVYLLLEPEPVLPPVVVSQNSARPGPKPAPPTAPKPAPKPTPVAAAPAPAPAAPASAPEAVPAPAAAAEPAGVATGSRVHIEAPAQVLVTLKRVEVVQGTSGRDEIAVIVDVSNVGYSSLARITFDASLDDTRSGKPVTVIDGSAADAIPWKAFLRQGIRRGQGAEIRLSYPSGSAWSSEQIVELVRSGRYQIRLKVASMADGDNRALPV